MEAQQSATGVVISSLDGQRRASWLGGDGDYILAQDGAETTPLAWVEGSRLFGAGRVKQLPCIGEAAQLSICRACMRPWRGSDQQCLILPAPPEGLQLLPLS